MYLRITKPTYRTTLRFELDYPNFDESNKTIIKIPKKEDLIKICHISL